MIMEEPVFNSEEQLTEGASQAIASEADPLTVSPALAIPSSSKIHPGRRVEHEHWLSVIQWLCGTIVIAVFVITFLTQAFQIPSESMENTLLVGDYLPDGRSARFHKSGVRFNGYLLGILTDL